MISGKTALLDAMIEAHQMEKGLREFYEHASSRAEGAEVKEAFDNLAGWEAEHMRYLQFLYQAIRDERETMTFENFRRRAPTDNVEGGIPVAEVEQTFGKRDFKDDRDALRLALDIETMARDFYVNLSQSVEDANTAVFLQDMVRQEERHIGFVKSLLATSAR